jgi:2Fe-2S ferredoxin
VTPSYQSESQMPKVTYIENNGAEHVIEVKLGQSVMEGAINNSVPGIDADCGGACACATCHVHVDPSWFPRLKAPDALERSMIDFATGSDELSRMSCQIKMTEALDGLVVRLPESQH